MMRTKWGGTRMPTVRAFDSINEFSKENVFFEILCAFFIALGYPVLKPFFKLLNVTLDRS
jgi:hypothetical protein